MKKRIFLLYVVFLATSSCIQEKKDKKDQQKLDTTLYTVLKDHTIVSKRDLQVIDSLQKLCTDISKANDQYYPGFDYSIIDKRVYSIELVNIPTQYLSKYLNKLEKLGKLEKLVLKLLKIDSFPDLSRFSDLRSLELYQVGFQKTLVFPQYLNRLTYFKITATLVDDIVFSKGAKIKFLNLSKNRIHQINNSYLYLDSLQKLNLYWNPIQDIQIDLNQFPHLKEVNLCGTATRDYIRKDLQKKYPHIKFNFCPEQIKVVFPDSVEAK